MTFSYADATKRRHRETPSHETSKSRKNGVINSEGRNLYIQQNNESKTTVDTGSSFRDIEVEKVRNTSKGGKSTHGHVQKPNTSNRVLESRRAWRNIADKTHSSRSPTSEQSSVRHSNGRRGKRKDINENLSDSQQKNSKPKPTLRSVSIGVLIAPVAKKKGKKGSVEPEAILSKSSQPQSKSLVEFPALCLSNRKLPTPTLKWGAPPRHAVPNRTKRGVQAAIGTKSKKAPSKNESTKRNAKSDSISSVAAVFLKPRESGDRARDGEEHQLLRLMQERTVYTKKGRQRVAPRKKKLTALKKKVLQERLKLWQELHPKDTSSVGMFKNNLAIESPHSGCFKSVCLYNFAEGADLEDDDEFEEVEQNLREMGAKVAEVERVFVPRGLSRSSMYPVFVRFKTTEGAAAAKACWGGLVIAGDALSAVSIDESNFNSDLDWPEQVVAAEGKHGFSQRHAASKRVDTMSTIVILGVLSEDDYEDSDCMEESLLFLKQAAAKYVDVSTVRPSSAPDGNVVLACACDNTTAQAVVRGLSSTVIAGKALSACVVESNDQPSDCLSLSYIVLENLLTQDDFDDKECLDETLRDVKELIEKHGKVLDISAEGDKVQIFFMGNISAAQEAVGEMHGLVLGGDAVFARIEGLGESSILLRNTLSECDVDDDDYLEESLSDIRELISKYGEVERLNIIRDQNILVVEFVPDTLGSSIDSIAAELNGSLIGDQIIGASSSFREHSDDAEALVADKPLPPDETNLQPKEPLYSGDKLIPEFFAECKRVPKIPNATGPRDYARVTNDERVRPLLGNMLRELMRLQKRAIEDKNAKARRRLVMGLREVCRGIRAHKVKMVVMANNLDEYGGTILPLLCNKISSLISNTYHIAPVHILFHKAIDEKLQEIIDLARTERIPLFFEFTKRSLGKALGKTIKVAVVGIQNADGAHQEFKKLIAIPQW
ncbi:MAG: hypothetical protein SGBAC_012032 [Bacillariaceae sp.]